MRNLKISAKLFLSHISLGFFILLALSLIFYSLLRTVLMERTLDQLSSINILKKGLVENYLFRSKQNLEALQVEAKFLNIYQDLMEKSMPLLANRHIADINNLCKLYDFRNIHIFDTHHNQLYSTDEKMYPEGLLAKIDSAISPHPDQLHIIDESNYQASNETLLFYYVPITKNDSLLGIVLVQENFQKIQSILQETTGMGSTGESYVVGPDKRMRSASRFFPDTSRILVDTEPVRKSLQGKPGRGITKDYRNIQVLSVYRLIENSDIRWSIISEIDEDEAMQPIRRLRNYLLIIAIVAMTLVTVITYFLSSTIVRPVLYLRDMILTLSKGIIPKQQPLQPSADEIGKMDQAIRQLIGGFERTAKFASEIGSGNFTTSFTTLSDSDVLGKSLIRMRDELREFHEKELRSAHAQAAALLEGQEKERRRIIKDLHDGVGQILTSIFMQVDLLENESPRKKEIKNQIDAALAEVKRISYDVMPQAIVDFGLEAALKGLCNSVKKYSSFEIDFRYVREIEHVLDFDISIAIFRIAQEGLNNIVKHADASNVNMHLLDREDEVYFILEDNGKGFNLDELRLTGSGLRNIKERVILLNGTVDIYSEPEKGTSVEIHIPKP